MGVEGITKCLKYLILIFNFFFFCLGCVLIGFGAWAEVEFGAYVELSSINYATGPRLVIAVGVVIAVVSFFGCCGAYKENKCMLTLFVTLLIILQALEVAAAVLAFKNRDKIISTLKQDIEENIKKYPENNLKPINDLQSKFECCGATGPKDWISNADYRNDSSVPDSCCKKKYENQDCGKGQQNTKTKIYTEGCSTKLEDMIRKNLIPIGSLAITMIVIQLLGVIFAVILICRIK